MNDETRNELASMCNDNLSACKRFEAFNIVMLELIDSPWNDKPETIEFIKAGMDMALDTMDI